MLHLEPAEDTEVWGWDLGIVLLCPDAKRTRVQYPRGFGGDSLKVAEGCAVVALMSASRAGHFKYTGDQDLCRGS